MPIGPALGADILNYVFRGQAVTPPTTLYASVGTYTAPTATEIAAARIPVRVNKGHFRGVTGDPTSPTLYFQAGEAFMIPIGGTVEVANPRLFWYKAASGGDPYYIGVAQSTNYPYAYPGDLWCPSGGLLSSTSYAGGIADASPGYAYGPTVGFAGYPFGVMLRDHFWRGIESYTVAEYPNVYLSLCSSITDAPTYIYVPGFAVARNASNWTVPAVDAAGISYITNTAALNFTFTVNMSSGIGATMYPHIRMFATRPGYDDRMYTTASGWGSYTVPGNVAVYNLIGDVLQVPIGGFKIGVF